MHEAINQLNALEALVCEVRDDLTATLPGLLMLMDHIKDDHSGNRVAMGIRGCMVPLSKMLTQCAHKLQTTTATVPGLPPQGVSLHEALGKQAELIATVNEVAKDLKAVIPCYQALIRLIERKHATDELAMSLRGALVPLCALHANCVDRLQDATASNQLKAEQWTRP